MHNKLVSSEFAAFLYVDNQGIGLSLSTLNANSILDGRLTAFKPFRFVLNTLSTNKSEENQTKTKCIENLMLMLFIFVIIC